MANLFFDHNLSFSAALKAWGKRLDPTSHAIPHLLELQVSDSTPKDARTNKLRLGVQVRESFANLGMTKSPTQTLTQRISPIAGFAVRNTLGCGAIDRHLVRDDLHRPILSRNPLQGQALILPQPTLGLTESFACCTLVRATNVTVASLHDSEY